MTFCVRLPVKFNKKHANNIAKALRAFNDVEVSVSDRRGINDLNFLLHITVPNTNNSILMFELGKKMGEYLKRYDDLIK